MDLSTVGMGNILHAGSVQHRRGRSVALDYAGNIIICERLWFHSAR